MFSLGCGKMFRCSNLRVLVENDVGTKKRVPLNFCVLLIEVSAHLSMAAFTSKFF